VRRSLPDVAVLHIALEEGFSDDEVAVSVDDAEVLHRTDVSTRMQLGLADATDATVEPGRHVVVVTARGASQSIDVEVEDELFVGISLSRSGVIEHRTSRQPFGYV
jgi:hypothetical protein